MCSAFINQYKGVLVCVVRVGSWELSESIFWVGRDQVFVCL